MDNTTSRRALGFLLWFRKFYSGETNKTYHQIADDHKLGNYGTVRIYLLELEQAGYVKIENKGKRAQKFVVNEKLFQTLI